MEGKEDSSLPRLLRGGVDVKFICKVFCVVTLNALFQAMPAQSADKGHDQHKGKPAMKESLVKGKTLSGITLKIAGGEIQGDNKVVRVKQGDKVKLNLMADKTTEVHLHGYDIEKTVSPGGMAVMAFQARVAGRFPVNGAWLSFPRAEKKRGSW